MQMMKTLVTGLAVATSLALTAPAALADGYVGAKGGAPIYVTPARWSSLYFGGHVGYGWSDVDYNIDFNGVNGEPFGIAADGWIAGGQIGLQHQFGNIVAGVELTLSGGGMGGDQDSVRFPGYIHTAELSWLFTATGKLGYAWDRWLVYVKAGYASADLQMKWNRSANPGFVQATDGTQAQGWTAGVGIEYMWLDSVSIGLEYRYLTLDANDRTVLLSNGVFQNQTGIDIDAHAVSLRLNFHLHRGHDAPASLK